MIVMLGPQVTQVEIPGQGDLPLNQPQGGSGSASGDVTPPALDNEDDSAPADDEPSNSGNDTEESQSEEPKTEPQ